MKIKITEDVCITFGKEWMLNLMLCVAWAAVLLPFVRGVINRVPPLSDHAFEVQYALVALSVVLALPALLNRFALVDYLFFFFSSFYLLANYVFFPENEAYLDDNVAMCIFGVFTFYFVGRLIDIDRYYNVFLLLSAGCVLLDTFYNVYYMPANKVLDEHLRYDNMGGAYQLLPHVLILLWSTLEKFRIWKAAILLVGVLYLLSCGTRGPFVCIGFFGLIYFFFFMNFRGAIYVKIGIILLFVLLLINLEDILFGLARTFTDMKLSTRILEKVLTGELGDDSYRSILRGKLESVVGDGDHFWGLGAFGCRHYGIIYPHFLPLDLVCTFGYCLGYILFAFLIALIGIALWLSKGTRTQVFILFLFSIGFVKLMLSNSFLLEPFFYMLIGACVKVVLDKLYGLRQLASDSTSQN